MYIKCKSEYPTNRPSNRKYFQEVKFRTKKKINYLRIQTFQLDSVRQTDSHLLTAKNLRSLLRQISVNKRLLYILKTAEIVW